MSARRLVVDLLLPDEHVVSSELEDVGRDRDALAVAWHRFMSTWTFMRAPSSLGLGPV